MSNTGKNYSDIFKSTFLFAFVQIVGITVKIILNKVVALVMGATGVGLIGLFSSVVGVVKTGAGLGVSQSAVRDISEANAANDEKHFSRTIITVNHILFYTSFLGFIVTILFSPLLSKWFFGDYGHASSLIFLSIAVAFTIYWEGQLAILKGMRRLRFLAKSNIYASVLLLFIGCPLYILFKNDAIIPVLILTPILALIFSHYYVKKIPYQKENVSFQDKKNIARPIFKMGIALSITIFLTQLSTFLISIYIKQNAGLDMLGFYNAGMMIMVGYFSVVINALTTDYYPRISAVNHDNQKIQEELNKQSIVSLLICFPLIVSFLFLLPFIIMILYSTEFLPVIAFIRIGIYGIFVTISSNQVDLILIAKKQTRVYVIISIIYRAIEVFSCLLLFHYYSLMGLGIAVMFMGLVHFVFMNAVVYKLYKIRLRKTFYELFFVSIAFLILSNFCSIIIDTKIRIVVGTILFIIALLFSYIYMKKRLNYNILKIFKRKK